jgi:hypothetical protein
MQLTTQNVMQLTTQNVVQLTTQNVMQLTTQNQVSTPGSAVVFVMFGILTAVIWRLQFAV